MLKTTIKLSRSNPVVKKLIAAICPDYKGRKIIASPQNFVNLYNTNWAGGSKNYYYAINLQSGSVCQVPAGTWYNPSDVEGNVNIPAGCAIIRRSYFCGHDMGLTIYYNGNNDILCIK